MGENYLLHFRPSRRKLCLNRTTPPQERRREDLAFAKVSVITDSDAALYKRQFLLIRNRLGKGSMSPGSEVSSGKQPIVYFKSLGGARVVSATSCQTLRFKDVSWQG